MDGNECRVDMREVLARRRRALRRRRLRRTVIVASCAVLSLAAIFLFSPWGAWKSLFFAKESSGESQVQTAAQEEQAAVEEGAVGETAADEGREGEKRGGGEAEEAVSRGEKASDADPPVIAIVIDDTGGDISNLDRWLAVDAPLTFAVMPHCQASASTAERLYAAGYRIMMHIPTENDPPNSFSGTGQLSVGMGRETVFSTLDGDLSTVPHAGGINNHQGGRGCNDYQLMYYMCEWAKQRGLFVVDSDSSTHSQVTKAARDLGFPRRCNQVFIDHHNEPDTIREAMRRLAKIARQGGTAIGICHFHRPNTPSVVGEMIRTLRTEGINFAFVEDIHN